MSQMKWSVWLTEQLKKKKWSPNMLSAQCKGIITESAIRKQVAEDRMPRAATRLIIEGALKEIFPGA